MLSRPTVDLAMLLTMMFVAQQTAKNQVVSKYFPSTISIFYFFIITYCMWSKNRTTCLILFSQSLPPLPVWTNFFQPPKNVK